MTETNKEGWAGDGRPGAKRIMEPFSISFSENENNEDESGRILSCMRDPGKV